MGPLKVVEMFRTVQGEGSLIGTPSAFLRLGRCNLTCYGCDTVWDRWKDVEVSDVVDQLNQWPERHLVVTGGEPTLWQDDLSALVACLLERSRKWVVTVETNGAVPLKNGHLIDAVALWSFSPKVGSLGRGEIFKWNVVYDNLEKIGSSRKQIKYVLNWREGNDFDRISIFQGGVDQKKLCLDSKVFFQPYDLGTIVNQIDRAAPFDVSTYAKDLGTLAEMVGARFGQRFRVLPQLHKIVRSDIVTARDERFNAIPARA